MNPGNWPTAATTVAGVIGRPVRHSLSPVLHNAAFRAAGLDWAYVAFDVPDGRAAGALDGARALGLAGLSVTMPHKTAVASLVDRLDPMAERLRSVNTVVVRPDGLWGHSTDGQGLLDSLRDDEGVNPEGMVVVVLGGGGAARAVTASLAGAGAAAVVVVNRTEAKAAEAARLAGARGRVGSQRDIPGADLVVNATPVGMGGGPDPAGTPFPADLVSAGQVVVDLVYSPTRTPLLDAAAQRGARAVGGLGMLVHQAALQFGLWTGLPAPLEDMRAAVTARLAG